MKRARWQKGRPGWPLPASWRRRPSISWRAIPSWARLLAIEAVNRTLPIDMSTAAEAEDALYRALQAAQLQLTLSGHNRIRVLDVVFQSRWGTQLATASLDRSVKLWDAATGSGLMIHMPMVGPSMASLLVPMAKSWPRPVRSYALLPS